MGWPTLRNTKDDYSEPQKSMIYCHRNGRINKMKSISISDKNTVK